MEDQGPLPFPYEFKELSPEHQKELDKLYSPLTTNNLRVGPKGYFVYETYRKDAGNIYNMPLRSSDIFVASYQRSGTTWVQELVWLLANDLDYKKAAKVPLAHRYQFIERFIFFEESRIEEYLKIIKAKNPVFNEEAWVAIIKMMAQPPSGMIATMPSPRFIKTHLPMSLLNPKLLDTSKMVYVARDPRDVAVSCYHVLKLFQIRGFTGDFKEFWNLFYRDLFILLPYFDHVKEAWDQRNHPNMLFVFYEELSKDLSAAIRRVATFLGIDMNQEQVDRLSDHLSFENFQKNASVNFEEFRELGVLAKGEKFIRKGKTGGWRDYFDEEMTAQAQHWIDDNLRDSDLRFPHM